MEGAAGRDLRRTDKDFDVLPVGVHLNAHLVHVEDEAGVDSVELCFDADVESLHVASFDVVSCRFTGDGVSVDELLSDEVLVQRLGSHGDAQLVVDVFHQHPHRDGFSAVIFGVNEVFDNFINVT